MVSRPCARKNSAVYQIKDDWRRASDEGQETRDRDKPFWNARVKGNPCTSRGYGLKKNKKNKKPPKSSQIIMRYGA